MGEPTVGVRREIGVLGKDLPAAHVLRELHEPATLAHTNVKRVERFHLIELVGSQEALA